MIKESLSQVGSRMMIMLINQIATLLTMPWLAKYLSLQYFGFIATSLILIQLGWIVINWGLNDYINEIWHNKLNQYKKNKLVTNILATQFFLFLLYTAFIALALILGVINLPWSFFVSTSVSIFFGGLLPLWFFHVNKKPSELVAITFISRLIFLLLVVICVRDDQHAITYICILAFTFMLITIYALYRMYSCYNIRLQAFSSEGVFRQISISTPFFLNSLSNNQIHTIWAFALSMSQSPMIIGIYSLADQGYRAGIAITNTISEIARLNTIRLSLARTWRLILMFLGLYLITLVLVLLSIDFVIYSFFNAQYWAAIAVIQIMACVWFVQAMVRLMNYPILSKNIGISRIHSLTKYILLGHLLLIGVWLATLGGLLSITLFFLFSSLLQLTLLIYLSLK